MHRIASFLVLGVAAFAAVGCSPPAATLELIAVARGGLADARAAQEELHEELIGQVRSRRSALDAAFDADVRAVAGGQVTGADGEPVTLDADWVISARKGYAAAGDLLAEQVRDIERARAVRLDNLAAADEALEMAADLILRQQAVGGRLREYVLKAQRRHIDD